MKTLLTVLFAVLAAGAYAATLSATDSGLIEEAGIPIYASAEFVYGGKEVGFRFATSDSPEVVRNWYREQLGSWSVWDDMGVWLLYDGPEGLDFGEAFSRNQVAVSMNDQLPGWHSLDKSMTTEIVIMIFE